MELFDDTENKCEEVKTKRPEVKTWVIVVSILAIIMILASVFIIGFFVGRKTGIGQDMPMMVEAYNLVKKYYYEDISWEEFQVLATKGAFDQVDPFTGIFNIVPLGNNKQLGITVTSDEFNNHAISFITPGSPSATAKATTRVKQKDLSEEAIVESEKQLPLSVGDEIYSVFFNNKWEVVKHADMNKFRNILNQIEGDVVKIRVIKYGILFKVGSNIVPSEELFYYDYIIPRAELISKKAYYYSPSEIANSDERQDVAMIKLLEFGDSATIDFKECVDSFLNDPMHPQKLILDLRGNGGGDAAMLAYIANFLVKSNSSVILLELHSKHPNGSFKREPLYTLNSYDYEGTKLESKYLGETINNFEVNILCDNGSASSSEVLIGDLIYYNDSKIIGTKTFGKGVGQKVFAIGNGKYHLYVTNGKYYLPSNNANNEFEWINIHGEGFTPLEENLIDRNSRPRGLKDDLYIRRALKTFK